VQLHPINQQALGGAPTAYHSYWQTTTVNDTVTYTSSKLCVGDRIKEVRAYVHENSGNAIAVSVSEHSAKDDTQSVLDSGASPGAGTFQEVVLNGGSLPFTLTAGVTVRVTVGDVAGGTIGRKYFLVELTVDHP
jgi:hypothetical protein